MSKLPSFTIRLANQKALQYIADRKAEAQKLGFDYTPQRFVDEVCEGFFKAQNRGDLFAKQSDDVAKLQEQNNELQEKLDKLYEKDERQCEILLSRDTEIKELKKQLELVQNSVVKIPPKSVPGKPVATAKKK